MQKYGAVIIGRYIDAVRNDGREFKGKIANVRALPKGTLVTIAMGSGYRNVYLENLETWDVYTDVEAFNTLFDEPWQYVASTY